MERHEILDAMNELKLYGMRASGACPRAGGAGPGGRDRGQGTGPAR